MSYIFICSLFFGLYHIVTLAWFALCNSFPPEKGQWMWFAFPFLSTDPVPDPRIWPQVISDTPSACRVTLRCQPSGPGDFNVSWRFESTPILEVRVGSADWYQLSANGTDLHLSSKPNFTDSNITCLVSNAVDQKQVSFDLSQICSSQGEPFIFPVLYFPHHISAICFSYGSYVAFTYCDEDVTSAKIY